MKEKWSWLRKNSRFEEQSKDIRTVAEKIIPFPELEDVFGKSWLDSQIKNTFFPFSRQRLGELEVAIRGLKNVVGFEAWKKNILSNPRDFDSYDFEIREISKIAKISEHLEIYPPVDKGAFSELKVSRNNIEFYIEMTKFRGISNPRNKIKKLIEIKGIKKIPKDSVGFIFVDTSDVTLKEYSGIKNGVYTCKIISNMEILTNEVDQFFKGLNTRILGIVFFEYYLTKTYDHPLVMTGKNICVKPNHYNKLGLDVIQTCNLIFPYEIKHK